VAVNWFRRAGSPCCSRSSAQDLRARKPMAVTVASSPVCPDDPPGGIAQVAAVQVFLNACGQFTDHFFAQAGIRTGGYESGRSRTGHDAIGQRLLSTLPRSAG
jgi:hypothetical protein